MSNEYAQFYKAINPSKTLVYSEEESRQYYIDFSSVRGGQIINKLKNRIVNLSPDDPTCSLFSGHIGCGKSTELKRLQQELETEGFYVVYIESSQYLEMADVDIIDVLMVIAQQITESLKDITINNPKGFRRLLGQVKDVLTTEVEVAAKTNIPMMGDLTIDSEEKSLKLNTLGIGEITVKAKNDAKLREKLNQYLGPQKTELLRLINKELLEPAIEQLRSKNLKGLVVIVDNLEKIPNTVKSFGKPQQEYLYIDQGEILSQLDCHMIYTMPLSLKFSNEFGNLTQRFKSPEILPMVSIKLKNGDDCEKGLNLLKQMVLARKYPQLSPEERLDCCLELFDDETSLDRLCRASGGHVRDLLQLLSSWLEEEMELPLTRETLEDVIISKCDEMNLCISDREWELLKEVQESKKVRDEEGYQKLIHSRMVFEYKEKRKSWFDINPILLESDEI